MKGRINMKVDMNKLTGRSPGPEKYPDPYAGMVKKAVCTAGCLALLSVAMVYQSARERDAVSADEPYDMSEADPQFIVQHMGSASMPDIQPGEGEVTVLTDGGVSHVALDGEGMLKTTAERVKLYEDYTAGWADTGSLDAVSFISSGYSLKEVWFGQDADSASQSDFLALEVPQGDNGADLSRITLTNNPEHPGLSAAAGGYYVPDGDGGYTVCIHDGDVVRLMFEAQEGWESGDADVFDYDVSDGGFYLEEDFFHRKGIHPTSEQGDAKGAVYADATECGIHSPENYRGRGAKLAFGGGGIGTELSEESLDGGLDTINIYNYGQQEAAGVAKGLAKGVGSNGLIQWADGVAAPDLFGGGRTQGRTDYTDGTYSFTFKKDGFLRTLSAVESEYGTAAEQLEVFTDTGGEPANSFWILDGSPSFGTDGHDIRWGSGSGDTLYYRTRDRAPEPFAASADKQDHNSFFGFSYTQDFILPAGYCGPLGFFGYSDDDMWAFAARVDEEGRVVPDTAVSMADLGGVHDGAGYYCSLWDKIGRVPYGEEGQKWRLSVFWLERDGARASCYLSFALPEAASVKQATTGSVAVEAGRTGQDAGRMRTFVFDDGTHNRYHGTCSDGTDMTVTSGEEFELADGSILDIKGLVRGFSFSVSETGAARAWHSAEGGYEDGDRAEGTVGSEGWVTFVSAEKAGTLSIAAEADGTPEGGYTVKLTADGMGGAEVFAMDGDNSPVGSRTMDGDGGLAVTLKAGEALKLCNLPEGAGFTLQPAACAGWHVSEILLNNAEASGASVSGTFPAYVTYCWLKNDRLPLQVSVEQSVTGEWGSGDIILGTGALLSYRITVANPNNVPVDATVTDMIPDGMELMESSLLEGKADGRTLTWETAIGAGSSAELSFTCEVAAEGGAMANTVRAAMDDGTSSESNTVTAVVP